MTLADIAEQLDNYADELIWRASHHMSGTSYRHMLAPWALVGVLTLVAFVIDIVLKFARCVSIIASALVMIAACHLIRGVSKLVSYPFRRLGEACGWREKR